MTKKMTALAQAIFIVLIVQGCWAKNMGTLEANQSAFSETQVSERGVAVTHEKYKLVVKNDWLLGGKHKPLCEEMLKSLNSFTDAPPMVCERMVNSEYGFAKPDWRPIKMEDIDWDLLKQIYFSKHGDRMREENLEKNWPGEKVKLESLAKKQTIVWHAEFDIDNKSGEENVLMLRDSGCNPSDGLNYNFPPDPTMHVVDAGGDLDSDYQLLDYTNSDAFFYRGHTYIAQWRGSPNFGAGEIRISDTFKPLNTFGFSNEPICSYRYIH